MYLKFFNKLDKKHIITYLNESQKNVFLDFYNFLDENKGKIENKTIDTFSEFKKIN